MANHFSALKRVRTETRRTEFNREAKTRLRHQIRAMRKALAGKEQKVTATEMSKTFSVIDRSSRIGIIKKNAAARYKSRLHARVKALQTA
jgi:small subunit ribosomal protein S20